MLETTRDLINFNIQNNSNVTYDHVDYLLKYKNIKPSIRWIESNIEKIVTTDKHIMLHNGNFELLLFLGQLTRELFTPLFMNDVIRRNNLNFIKKIYKIKNVTRYLCNNKILSYAASSGHLNIVKWLYKKYGKNGKICASHAIKCAIRHNHLHIARWLSENRYEMNYDW